MVYENKVTAFLPVVTVDDFKDNTATAKANAQMEAFLQEHANQGWELYRQCTFDYQIEQSGAAVFGRALVGAKEIPQTQSFNALELRRPLSIASNLEQPASNYKDDKKSGADKKVTEALQEKLLNKPQIEHNGEVNLTKITLRWFPLVLILFGIFFYFWKNKPATDNQKLIESVQASSATEISCAPKSKEAKILASKNPNDIHKEWGEGVEIGLSWSLMDIREDGAFLSGTLVTPRGGVKDYRVFVVRDEWNCLKIIKGVTPHIPEEGSVQSSAPSFDCSKASNVPERLICSDIKLSDLDVQMVETYKIVKENSLDAEEFTRVQSDWLRNIRNKCLDKQCLVEVYQLRISELLKY